MRRAAALFVLVALLCDSAVAVRAAGGLQQPAFRATTVVVEVSAVITKDGEPVPDIRAEEVVVSDEGVPQELVAFEYVDHVVSSEIDDDVTPAVAARAPRAGSPGRDYVLLVDDLHVDPRRTRQTRDIATALIDGLAPNDRLAIVNTGPFDTVLQLTTDRNAARRMVRQLRGQRTPTLGPGEQEIKTLIMLRVLKGIADRLAGDAARRRSILVVSEGQPLGPGSPEAPGDHHDVWRAYEDVVAAAAAANVAIYAVSPAGLEAPVAAIRATSDREAALSASTMAQQSADAMLGRYYGTLGRLSTATGGTLTTDSNALAQGVRQMLDDSRRYYRLAYRQPALAEGEERRPRTIRVTVSRPGVDVRARTAYVPR